MRRLIEQIDNELASLAWSLWSTLGVAGNSPQHQNWLIDLEELIILTAVISECDPRLRDEALDWCSKFHYFVSVTRLRTLVVELGAEVYASFSIFAETLNSISQSKWPTFIKTSPLRMTCSGKSQPPSCEVPGLLNLRLRAFFGVGARADLATFFLTRKLRAFSASDMVEIGYNKRTLAIALDSFVQAGLLTDSMSRNQKKYELSRRDQLTSLAGELPNVVPDWRRILMVLVTMRTALQKHQEHSISSKIVAMSNALASLEEHLHELNISPPQLSSDSESYWNSVVGWFNDMVKALAVQGNFREVPVVAHKLEETVISLMQNLYRVDDCIDGLEFIVSSSVEHSTRHQEIFKECFQMSICYLDDLKIALEDLLKFPIHLLMDLRLSDVMYKYSQEDLKAFLLFVKKFPSSVTHSRDALSLYQRIEGELNKLHKFVYEIKERLKELYVRQTNVHLLTQSSVLFKRHTVLRLFDPS